MFAFREKSSTERNRTTNATTLPNVTNDELQIFYAMKNSEQRLEIHNSLEQQKEKYRKNFQIKMANKTALKV